MMKTNTNIINVWNISKYTQGYRFLAKLLRGFELNHSSSTSKTRSLLVYCVLVMLLIFMIMPKSLYAMNIDNGFNGDQNAISLSQNNFGYSCAYTDEESGDQYLNARYYSPELKVFISRDTYDLSNRYAYCEGNPINNIDPTGHSLKNIMLGSLPTVLGTAAYLAALSSMPLSGPFGFIAAPLICGAGSALGSYIGQKAGDGNVSGERVAGAALGGLIQGSMMNVAILATVLTVGSGSAVASSSAVLADGADDATIIEVGEGVKDGSDTVIDSSQGAYQAQGALSEDVSEPDTRIFDMNHPEEPARKLSSSGRTDSLPVKPEESVRNQGKIRKSLVKSGTVVKKALTLAKKHKMMTAGLVLGVPGAVVGMSTVGGPIISSTYDQYFKNNLT